MKADKYVSVNQQRGRLPLSDFQGGHAGYVWTYVFLAWAGLALSGPAATGVSGPAPRCQLHLDVWKCVC
jgi:hypothetical protein